MNIAIILAGGVGKRLGLEKPKQFMKVAGRTVLEHTVEIFQKHEGIDEIVIVMNAAYVHDAQDMVLKNHWTKVKKILNGGSERYESSLAAIRAYENYPDKTQLYFIFHDAVRPLVSKKIIDDTIEALKSYDAVDVAIASADTIIKLDSAKKFIAAIPERDSLNRGQTPQAFKYPVIAKAYELALADPAMQTTDDCGLVRKYLPDIPIYVVQGAEQNVKLTYPEDIYVLDKLFQLKASEPDSHADLVKLRGKVMVAFGGNSGIGLDMVRIARRYGAQCFAFSRSTTGTDISRRKDVEGALRQVADVTGRIDYIVNSAAILNKEPLMHLEASVIDKIIDINYRGMVNVSVEAYRYLKAARGALLQFTSSSYTRGRANYALYSSTKAAVVNFVQAIAEEWEQDGIRINCINPQRTKTPMRIANFGNEPEETLLRSADVAAVALKTLLSDFSGEVVDVKL
ncbi:MAG: bifunctional cytidylyltransferase/SDR family oxidoreductase [Phascolarctobacterium sp.]|uniref:bifunctional cytidylyltransferase/SDR family oxidoreductase n=1 Tax=Phascolarctobacterium sp. TaxID=2049039 RepID=UPI0026DD5F48|nr:bifunctional cytidylyltransferase/SDR family oxidoreductase [Phascolarctobacterium sp.]MDO4921926.1 bifunctional cytidylyltransferase/SDR family oxidoreductase [Phascolarctobacterium sp.]